MFLRSQIANRQSPIANRLGLSLTEVLISIFVMAIGMISLLVLFPVGMQNMVAALRGSRLTHVAAIAEAQTEMPRMNPINGLIYTVRTDPQMATSLTNVVIPNQNTTTTLEQYTAAGPFYDNVTVPPIPSPWWPWLFDTSQAGPPVFIDPQGQSLWPNRTIGTDPNNVPVVVTYKNGTLIRSFGIRRCGVTFASAVSQIRRTFVLEDELTFEPNGEVRRSTVGPNYLIERERRHSWGYLWRRPRFSEIKVADLAVVIYQGRQIEGVAGFGNPPEPYFKGHSTPALDPSYVTTTCDLAFRYGSTTARLKFNTTQWSSVPVKRGDIVLDATVIPPRPNVSLPLNVPAHFNGYFYKVVGVGEAIPINATEAYQEIELNRPALNDGYIGVMITGLAEIIEKNDGKMPPG